MPKYTVTKFCLTLMIFSLAYLADIFEKLNILNLKLQEKDTTSIQLHDNVKAFVSKQQK